MEKRIGDRWECEWVLQVRSYKGGLRSKLLEDVCGRTECSRLSEVRSWLCQAGKVGQGWRSQVGQGGRLWQVVQVCTAHHHWQLGCLSLQGKQPDESDDDEDDNNQ